ncbi:MAG: hypothetical protein QGG96_04215 [Candidatus Poseidoniaceae archaeon]|jgi:hypothetical protein|nr:hypothetical protein [Candidatus Poseidoniaceae archaeon]
MNRNQVFWVIALIGINILWSTIADNNATQEINRPGADFAPERQTSVNSIIGDSAIPASLECDFSSEIGVEGEVGWSIMLDSQVIASWDGNSSENCVGWSGELSPGEYTITTTNVEGIDASVQLHLQPFEPVRWYGHIVFSILLFALGGGEIVVRMIMPKKVKKVEEDKEIVELEPTPSIESQGIWQDPIR